MKFKLFSEVVLLKDFNEKKLKKGDVGTIVEYHPSNKNENGYTLEIFNALGDSIAIITVSENEIEALKGNELFSVRSIEAAQLK